MYSNNEIASSLKRSHKDILWWDLVQEEVKQALNFIIDNVSWMGIPFRDAFIHLFSYEHCSRLLYDEALDPTDSSSFFGQIFPEECYQSGRLPVKIILKLDEWVEPNEADVRICMTLSQQIDALEKAGILIRPTHIDYFSDSVNSIMSHLKKSPHPLD